MGPFENIKMIQKHLAEIQLQAGFPGAIEGACPVVISRTSLTDQSATGMFNG